MYKDVQSRFAETRNKDKGHAKKRRARRINSLFAVFASSRDLIALGFGVVSDFEFWVSGFGFTVMVHWWFWRASIVAANGYACFRT
jgi:hypothetical protein